MPKLKRGIEGFDRLSLANFFALECVDVGGGCKQRPGARFAPLLIAPTLTLTPTLTPESARERRRLSTSLRSLGLAARFGTRRGSPKRGKRSEPIYQCQCFFTADTTKVPTPLAPSYGPARVTVGDVRFNGKTVSESYSAGRVFLVPGAEVGQQAAAAAAPSE